MAYLFEQRYDLAFSAVRVNVLTGGDLMDYNVLILPHGDPEEYRARLGERGIERLKAWIQQGGTLVLIKGAARLAMHESVKLTTSQCVSDLRKLKPEKETKEQAPSSDPVPDEHKPDSVQGAVLRAKLDPYHFLSFGYGETVNVLVYSDYVFTPSKAGHNVAAFVEPTQLRISGLISDKMRNALANQSYLIDEPTGQGHVILFADDPNFRATWDSLNRLFLNSLFFAPSLQR
jgi:hypothetical protein